MRASNKYEYQSLSLGTFLYSLRMGFQVLIKAPEVLLVLMLGAFFNVSDLIAPVLIMYGLCRTQFIDEQFKGQWGSLKKTSLLLSIYYIAIIVSIALSSPDAVSGNDTDSGVTSSFVLLLAVGLKGIIYLWMTSLSAEVYDQHRGKFSGFYSVLKDRPMLLFLLGCGVLFVFTLDTLYPYMEGSSKFLLLCGVTLLEYFGYFVVIAHIYTPDIPKKHATQPVLQT